MSEFNTYKQLPRSVDCDAGTRRPVIKTVLQHGSRWELTWSDDFSGAHINESNWRIYNNQTHGATEKELYVKEDAYIANGTLILETKPQKIMHGLKQYNYTSGWVESKNLFYQKFGRFEIRARLPDPRAIGNWPAHWLMPQPSTSKPPFVCWPVGGEIDIMEAVGGLIPGIVGTYHWAKECGKDLYDGHNGKYPTKGHAPINFSLDYHLFAVEWNETTLVWSVDNNVYHARVANATLPIPQDPFYIILNTAIAGYFAPNTTEYYPCFHYIDYVRVYKAVKI